MLSCVKLSKRLSSLLIALLWPQKKWYIDLSDLLVAESLEHSLLWNLLVRKFHRSLELLCLHAWRLSNISSKRLGFLRGVTEVGMKDLMSSTAALYEGKWSRFPHWCCGQNLSPCKATVQQIAKFFLYLRTELKLCFLQLRAMVLPLAMYFCWQMLIWLPLMLLAVCSTALRGFAHCVKLNDHTEIYPWFCGALLVCLMSPLSLISTLPSEYGT